jgi:hypothetical protein
MIPLTSKDMALVARLNVSPCIMTNPLGDAEQIMSAMNHIAARQAQGTLLQWMQLPTPPPPDMCETCFQLGCMVFTFCAPECIFYRHEFDNIMILKVEVDTSDKLDQAMHARSHWLNAAHDLRN